MSAAANHKQNENEYKETFILNANIVPQDFENNTNFWSRFEIFVREQLTKKFEKLIVVTGPLFIDEEVERNEKEIENKFIDKNIPKKIISYQVLGKNNVSVKFFFFLNFFNLIFFF
jgi:DNA/RNA endonuclease G (NUC1)